MKIIFYSNIYYFICLFLLFFDQKLQINPKKHCINGQSLDIQIIV